MATSSSASADGFWFDEDEADRVVRFFETCLRHVTGRHAGRPFVPLPWQRSLLRELFGWKRADGTRRYRTCYLEIPRKNGKTTFSAGIGAYLLFADREYGAQVYSAAASREQARLLFDTAKRMVMKSPVLSKSAKAYRNALVYEPGASSWKVLSSDAPTTHGIDAHGILFDELHAQRNRELFDVLTTSTGARSQPLVVLITTAGYDRESVCWEQHHYARQVADGVIEDPSFLPVLYSADEGDDWTDPETWRKANPSLGHTLSETYLEEQCRKAKSSPALQNTFRRLHLNQWTRQRDRWLDLAKWDACAGDLMPAELEEALVGRYAYGGLDLASTTDVTAFVLVFPPREEGERWDVLARFWVPEESIRIRTERDRVMYESWAREGWLVETPGQVTDYGWVLREIAELSRRYEIRSIAFDRWGSTKIKEDLEGAGLEVVAWGQGYASMSTPTRELLHLVLGRSLRHGGHPVLRWMADNLVVREDPAGNVKPDKAKSTEKIDGMVALIMAIGAAYRTEGRETAPSSPYENREMRIL